MAYVSESDISIGRALLRGIRTGKSKRWVRRLVLLSIPIFFLYWFRSLMLTSGEGDMGTSALIALLFAGFYALWLVFLFASITSARAMLALGTRGKAFLAVSVALTLAVFVWFGSVTAPFAGVWFLVLFSPFVLPVANNLVMLIGGFFTKSPFDGDEELAQSVDKLAANDEQAKEDKDAR